MRKKMFAASIAALALAVTSAAPATAITDGELDGEAHPYVGLMIAKIGGEPQWRCSGTLISPTVFLTAGHCTSGATSVEIWFESDLQSNANSGYPYNGEVSGMPYTHPEYDEDAFFLFDLGIVVLDTPVAMTTYGTLPTLNVLDKMATKRGKQDLSFTAVGYGLQKSFPDAAAWKTVALKTRMVAYPRLTQINTGFTGTQAIHLSNNANTGGTCSGDSGGPNFIGSTTVIGGVTSYGLNSTCAGTGGVYRVDRADDLDWIDTFLNP